ncbi:hypothetical protein [Nocardioides iriomotensis]|uniref:Uncharacterized protein n=1 Tax=Nocardioides iriomotensis TaxID=715784 RepID=A0A4Q5J898_9ACTN|nr:hypothetical protein [Nocardioides iriomotensis]RYU14824.1 hypothetical protein ETU37_02215 [Nocardioides iriomotensis]
MRTRRLLGASLTTVLAVGLVGAATPTATAGDNDKADWSGTRALRIAGDDEAGKTLVTARNRWALLAQDYGNEIEETGAARLRERGRDGVWRNPENLPAYVNWFRHDTNANGWTIGAYVKDGALFGVLHTPRGRVASTSELARAVASEVPRVVAADRLNGLGLIEYGDRLIQRVPARKGNTDPRPAYWTDVTDADADGDPSTDHDYFLVSGGVLAVNPSADGQSLVLRKQVPTADGTGTTWTDPQSVPMLSGIDIVHRAPGVQSLIGAGSDGVTMYDLTTPDVTNPGVWTVGEKRVLHPSNATPTAVIDGRGDLTVYWREDTAAGAGTIVWQADRPQGKYLERPTFIGGTRSTETKVTVSPAGTITVLAQPLTGRWSPLKVKHLPAGKSSWTRWQSLAAPAPQASTIEHNALGTAQPNGDLTTIVGDARGVYAFMFDAPRQVSKMTRPVNRTQKVRTYTIAWNTTWAYASDWQVRARVDKGKRYGAWRNVAVPEGQRFKDVTRPRGEKRCYAARGLTPDGWTVWSNQRCVTVRR